MAHGARERILEVAGDLFYRDGFHAVGVDRIVDAASTTKTTFYRHFESKDALILCILQNKERWWQRTFAARLAERGGPAPAGQLRAVFDVLGELFETDMFNGCIFVNVAVEFPLPRDPVHLAAAEHHRTLEAFLRDLAVRAGVGAPVDFAARLTLLMNAAFLTLQVTGDLAALEPARGLADMLLDAHLGPSSAAETAGSASPGPT